MDALIADDHLRRTSSNNSTSSSRVSSAKGKKRVRPRKTASNASLQLPASDKSFTSFPSLSPSPEASPIAARSNGDPSGLATPEPQPEPEAGLPDPPTIRKASKSVQSLVGTLVSASPVSQDRTALFDDTPQDARSVPGNLHHADDDTIRRLLVSRSPTGLVRQLATDLARRDAQVTALRRRAEERERILRRMLQECEVSNLDIENRLKELDRGHRSVHGGDSAEDSKSKRRSTVDFDSPHPDDPMDRHLARALAENDDSRRELLEEDDSSSLVPFPSLGDNSYPGSINSTDSYPTKPKENGRGWKSYLWNGTITKRSSKATSLVSNEDDISGQTRSRASSGTQNRKSLNYDTFVPPNKNLGAISSLRRLGSEDRSGSDVASRRSSGGSVASWALRMVAGNNQMLGDRQGTLRGRQASDRIVADSNRRTASMDTAKVTRTLNGAGPNQRGRAARLSLGPNGTIKSVSPESSRASNSGLHPGSPPPTNRSASNLGPVEMDMILPEDSRPPTLLQHHNTMSDSAEYLTDRFGFIYDQRRKKRQAEAAAAMKKNRRHTKVESLGNAKDMLRSLAEDGSKTDNESEDTNSVRPASIRSHESETQTTKKWQDYLKLATFPTELLSHTPSVAPITGVDVEDATPKASQVSVQKRGSLPASSTKSMPAPSRVSSSNAEFAQPSAEGPVELSLSKTQPDPVKALLEQLTELHDSLQQSKTVKWNDFLRRVRAERKREGDAAAASEGRSKNSMPEALITDGEIIGIAGLGNKGKVGRAKWKEFKNLVLGGIPVNYRAKIWAECSGANGLRVPGYYDDLVSNGVDEPEIVGQIQMDINRTLTDNIYFRRGAGVQKLREVLLAYSRRNPSVGYCQGMNLITACLLLIMPTAEDAFWVLATMIENILPDNYYDHSLLASRADQQVLRQYVTELLPRLSAHFEALNIELEALTFQWFLSVFTDCLSAEALFRVWDVVLCMHDGSTFLFQIALALLKLNEPALVACDSPAGVYHYINQQMTNHAISIDGLIQASEALTKVVRRKDVEERRARAIEAEQELMRERAELQSERRRKRQSVDAGSVDQAEAGHGIEDVTVSPVLDDAMVVSSPGPASVASPTVTATTSGSRDDFEEDDLMDALEPRTPMPIDEEAMWRA